MGGPMSIPYGPQAQVTNTWDPFGLWENTIQAEPIRVEPTAQKAAPAVKSRAVVYPAAAEGAKMSNGRAYDPKALTIAHDSLPIGSTVTISAGGKTVTATVTDRLTRKKDKKRDATHFVVSGAVARSLNVKRGDMVRLRANTLPGEGIAQTAQPVHTQPAVAKAAPKHKPTDPKPTPASPVDTPFNGMMTLSMPKDSFSPYDSVIYQQQLLPQQQTVQLSAEPVAQRPLSEAERVAQMAPAQQKKYWADKWKAEQKVRVAEAKSVAAAITAKMASTTNYNFTLSHHESRSDPQAVNKDTDATGMWQFLQQTWLGQLATNGVQYAPELAQLISYVPNKNPKKFGKWVVNDPEMKQKILDMRKDPAVSTIIHNELTDENPREYKRRTGQTLALSERYHVHFLGVSGFIELKKQLARDPDQLAINVFPDIVGPNKPVFYKDKIHGKWVHPRTLAEVYDFFYQKTKTTQPLVIANRDALELKQAFASAFDKYGITPDKTHALPDAWTGLSDLAPLHSRPLTAAQESTAVVRPFSIASGRI